MKKFLIIFTLLVLCCSISSAANIYVRAAAVGAGTGTAADYSNAMSLAVAVSTGFTAGNTYHLYAETYTHTSANILLCNAKGQGAALTTYVCDSGTATVTADATITGGYYGSMYLLNSDNIKFQNITFTDGSGNARNGLRLRSTTFSPTNIQVTGCTFTQSTSAGYGAVSIEGDADTTVACSFTSNIFTLAGTSKGVTTAYGGRCIFSTNTFTNTGTGRCIDNTQATYFDIYDNDFTTSGSANVIYGNATVAGGIYLVRNNTITCSGNGLWGIYIFDYFNNVLVENNTIYSNNNASVMSGIAVGKDAATAGGAMGQCVIRNNTFSATGTTAVMGHGILIGSGADGADVYNNKMLSVEEIGSTVNIGCCIKAERCYVHNNVFEGTRGLLLKGGGYNNIYNNTIIALETYGVSWVTDTDTPLNNKLINNIVDASSGTYALFAATSGHFNNLLDYNCYYLGSAKYASFDNGGTDKTTLALGLVYWAALTDTIWTDNDSHSISADPRYTDSANNDFSIRPLSPCTNTGNPTIQSGCTSIGAYQPTVLDFQIRDRY